MVQSKIKKREHFIKPYYDKYQTPELPAVWMVAEVLPLGSWSIIFANLVDRENQKIICKHFGINYVVMESWLHALTYFAIYALIIVSFETEILP